MSAPLVLVTGVSGFIGAHCALAALQAGYRVRGTVRKVPPTSEVTGFKGPDGALGIEFVAASLDSSEGWREAVEGEHIITVHLRPPTHRGATIPVNPSLLK